MQRLKSIISLLLSIILALQVANITMVYAASDYENHWAKSYIENLLDEGVVSGYEDGSIKPDNNVTRAEFVTLTNKLFKYNVKADSNFVDINNNAWYSDQFLVAKQANYLTGDNRGYANPESAITRAEVCVIVSKVLNLETTNYTNFTDDNLIPTWSKGYIGALSKAGLIKGYPDGSFGAAKNITRAEAFVIINNILDNNSSYDTTSNTTNNTISNDNVTASNYIESTTNEATETTTVKKFTSSGGGGGGGGSSTITNTTTTETTTLELTETTTIPVITPGGEKISRQEWINSLVTNLNLTTNNSSIVVSNPDDENYTDGTVLENYSTEESLPYSDISNATYKDSIVTAYEYGIIPDDTDDGLFDPDASATREFVAVTAVKALNFLEIDLDISSWDDYSELKYPIQDAIAVDTALIPLVNNSFLPNTSIDSQLESYVLNRITEISSPIDIDEDSEDIIEYADGVKSLDNVTNYVISNDEKTVTITEYTGNISLNENDIIVLPSIEQYFTGYAFVVESVEKIGDSIIIKGHTPDDILDVISNIHFEGSGVANVGDIILEDGVTMSDDTEVHLSGIGTSGTYTDVLKKKFSFNKSIMDDKANINGSINLEIPSIDYKIDLGADWRGIKINDLYVVINSTAQAKGELNVTYSDNGLTGSEKLKLATIPIEIAPTLSANINVWLSVDASGKFTVTYTLSNEFGINVINNSPHLINNSDSNFDVFLEGDLKMGANLGISLNFIKWDLVDIATEAGVGARATLESHINPVMICIDGKVYFYWNISALENSLAGDIFNKSFNKEVYNIDNSPAKLNLHLESREDTNGFVKVPECTYGRGTLNGYVADARDRTSISNATATIYNSDGNRVKKLYSDSNGEYNCQLKSGNYKLTVTADGYKPFNYSFSITSNQETYAESLLLINTQDTGNSIASGTIINSITGANIPDVTLNVYNDWNNTNSEIVATTTTNENGTYTIELPSGNYTFVFKKEGYVPTFVNVALVSGENTVNYYINPENSDIINTGTLQIVLTWGNTPKDLDSHLVSTNGLHTYFDRKQGFNSNGDLEADLDLDDIDGEGPETTVLRQEDTSATYSFYVHDYSNRYEDSSNKMSYSNAQVKVSSSGQEIATFNIPTNEVGTLWHVFDYNPVTHLITPVNTFSNHTSPSTVGGGVESYSLEDLENDLKDYEKDDMRSTIDTKTTESEEVSVTEENTEICTEMDDVTVSNIEDEDLNISNSEELENIFIEDSDINSTESESITEDTESNNVDINSDEPLENQSEETSDPTILTIISDVTSTVENFINDIISAA